MASSYPAVPANRMLLDRDGAGLNIVSAGDRTRLPDADLVTVNNESLDDLGETTDVDAYLLAFPELRDVKALYLGFVQSDPDDPIDVAVQASRDTTDGMDGVWAELYPSNRVNEGATAGWWGHTAAGDYRRYIRAVPTPEAATGLRAVRVEVTPSDPGTTAWKLVSVHVFGVPAYEANPHQLAVWHPWLDQRVPGGHFDWGNAPLGSSAEKSFRIKNLSFDRTASGITVSVDALTDADPPFVPQLLLSVGGGSFTRSATITELAPGAISRVVTVRRVTPSDAEVGPWAQRVLAAAGTWLELP